MSTLETKNEKTRIPACRSHIENEAYMRRFHSVLDRLQALSIRNENQGSSIYSKNESLSIRNKIKGSPILNKKERSPILSKDGESPIRNKNEKTPIQSPHEASPSQNEEKIRPSSLKTTQISLNAAEKRSSVSDVSWNSIDTISSTFRFKSEDCDC